MFLSCLYYFYNWAYASFRIKALMQASLLEHPTTWWIALFLNACGLQEAPGVALMQIFTQNCLCKQACNTIPGKNLRNPNCYHLL